LETYFQGLIWSSDKLNLTYIKEFNKLIFVHFGPEIFKEMQFFTKVDKELKQCFESIEPSPNEIKDYLEKFCTRYEIKDFGFGGKKNIGQPKDGGQQQQQKKNNDDLYDMLANLKNDFNNNGAQNQPNQQGFVQPVYDPTQPPQVPYQNYQNLPYNPNFQQPGYNYGYPQQSHPQHYPAPGMYQDYPQPINNPAFQMPNSIPAFPQPINNPGFQMPNSIPAFPQQPIDNKVSQNGFNYPETIQTHIDPKVSQNKIDEMNNIPDMNTNNYENLGDDHIKALIESNIKKSYEPHGNPNVSHNPEDRENTKEEGNIDDLIARLKELGVTLPNQKVSSVHYDAQKYYKSSNMNVNDYKIDFDTHNKGDK